MVGGHNYQAALWRLEATGRLVLHDLTFTEINYMAALMEKYQDTPMDMADASLMAVAESASLSRVFTLDSHFRIYRLGNGSVLTILP
jgi:predicted nucleic acid-binding protein